MLGIASAMLLLVGLARADSFMAPGNLVANPVNVVGVTATAETGMTIHKFTNNVAHVPINFTSTSVLVGAPGAGSAILAQSGFISSLTISAPGFTFSAVEFNPQTLSSTGILMVTALMSNGKTFTCPGSACNLTTYGNSLMGQNRLTVFGINGERIESVTISSILGPGTGFHELTQVRFNGGTGGFEVIPEPGTLGLLGTGLIGLAGMVRRKLKNDRTAAT